MAGAENQEMRCESKPTKCEKLMRYRDEWCGIIPSRPVAVRVIRIRCRRVMDSFDASKKVLTIYQPQGVDQKESMGGQMQIETLSVESTKQIVIA